MENSESVRKKTLQATTQSVKCFMSCLLDRESRFDLFFFCFFVFFSCALCPEAAAVDALIHEEDEVGFSLVPESVLL